MYASRPRHSHLHGAHSLDTVGRREGGLFYYSSASSVYSPEDLGKLVNPSFFLSIKFHFQGMLDGLIHNLDLSNSLRWWGVEKCFSYPELVAQILDLLVNELLIIVGHDRMWDAESTYDVFLAEFCGIRFCNLAVGSALTHLVK